MRSVQATGNVEAQWWEEKEGEKKHDTVEMARGENIAG